MMDSKKAYVICSAGLSDLQTMGLKHGFGFQSDMAVKVERFEESGLSTDADCWLATPAMVIGRLDFFMLRKEKTLVFDAETGSGQFRHVAPDAPVAEIIRVVMDVLTRNEETVQSHTLSARETEVLCSLAGGLTAREIADKLCISVNTVVTHRKNISAKLGIRSVSGLSLYAVMNGLI